MRGEYTIAAAAAPIAVLVLELAVLRTGLLRRPRFWAALALVLAFQVPVDGWLTWHRAPVVSYSAAAVSGLRAPWDIPVEDFGFGFALAALTLLLWEWNRRRDERAAGPERRSRPGLTGEAGALRHGFSRPATRRRTSR